MKEKTNNNIYNAIDYSFINKEYIKNTYCPRYKKDSKTSLTISKNKQKNKPDPNENKLILIEEIFGLKDDKNIQEKFYEATNGSGNEEKKITVLHSSSLCAFLHFYNIKNKPLIIDDIKYDKVMFEFQNEVFKDHNPSNVDIVLISSKHKKIMFLESKFSEYLTISNQYKGLSKAYQDTYYKLNMTTDYNITEEKGKITLTTKDNKKHYINGIKQMISHYIGVKNFIKHNNLNIDQTYEVILGSILFDGWPNENYLNDYQKIYKNLANRLNNDITKPKNLTIMNQILTYQETFKNYNLDENVKKFYRY